jgi:MFS transporter, DHA1 family, multidrug resistance protein
VREEAADFRLRRFTHFFFAANRFPAKVKRRGLAPRRSDSYFTFIMVLPKSAVDGGQSWQKTLWILFGAQVCTAIGFSTINPFLPLYLGRLQNPGHIPIATLSGLVYTAQAFAMMIASPVWGSIADRYGRKPMVVRAMLGGGLTVLLMGFVRTVEELIILRILQGFLSGAISATSALVAAKAPSSKIGYSMGVLELGLWSGVSIGPLIGGMVSDYFGFRAAFIFTTVLLCASGAVVWIAVDEFHTRPDAGKRGLRSFARNWKRILLYPGLIAILVLRFLTSLGRNALMPVLPLFVLSLMPDNTHIAGYTGLILALSSAFTAGSAMYLGKLGDRIGHQRIAFFSAVFAALFFLPQSMISSTWQLLVLYALTGLGIGGLTPSLSSLLARFSKPSDAGSVYGIDNSTTSAARALAPMLAASIAAGFGMRWVFSATGLLFVMAAIGIAVLMPGKNRSGHSLPEPISKAPEVKEAELGGNADV